MVALNARLQLLRTGQRQQEALVDLFTALAEKARDISRVISAGDGLGNTSGAQNADGDTQKALDVLADGEFLEAAGYRVRVGELVVEVGCGEVSEWF